MCKYPGPISNTNGKELLSLRGVLERRVLGNGEADPVFVVGDSSVSVKFIRTREAGKEAVRDNGADTGMKTGMKTSDAIIGCQ